MRMERQKTINFEPKTDKTEKSRHEKTGHVGLCICASVGVFVLTLIHLIEFVPTSSLLDGHKYGAPDKYGDYARGLYKSEVVKLSSGTKTLWLLLLGMIILTIVAKITKPKDNSSKMPGVKIALSCFYIVIACVGICTLGTLYVSMVGGMYH